MEEVTGQRSGVVVGTRTTTSARKARKVLVETLEAGEPLMIQCDMGFLPYFDFGGKEYHFGGHVVVVCGYDPEAGQVLVADRDEVLHPVSMEDLSKARGSTFRPFPPKNLWYTFDFAGKRPPTDSEVRQSILEMSQSMLEPPIRNIGVKGIRKAAQMVTKWPEKLDADQLRLTLFNAWIFISPEGGSGGGCFRYMLSRYLQEAAWITDEPGLEQSADDFEGIGDAWQQLAERFREASEEDEPDDVLSECVPVLTQLAEREEEAWERVQRLAESEQVCWASRTCLDSWEKT
jgi:hypothetical protein